MMLGECFEKFLTRSPVSVMVRGILERVFDVGLIRSKRFRLIELVQQLEHKIAKPGLVESFGKRLADKIPRLFLIHVDLTKYEERITSRGLNMYALSCARVG